METEKSMIEVGKYHGVRFSKSVVWSSSFEVPRAELLQIGHAAGHVRGTGTQTKASCGDISPGVVLSDTN